MAGRDLPHSWRPGCPVGPSQLRVVRLTYWGFDRRPHVGALVVRDRVAGQVVRVFRRLYAARFPIRRMRKVDAYRGSDDASMAADNTSAFNCRFVSGTRSWSQHAYGEAIDVNPCHGDSGLTGRIGPSGADLVAALTARPGLNLSAPSIAPIGGYPSTLLTVTVPSSPRQDQRHPLEIPIRHRLAAMLRHLPQE